MSSPTPIVLPENYFDQWASKPAESHNKANPFNDSKANSRVTASGFTDTTVTPRTMMTYEQAKKSLQDELARSDEQSRILKREQRKSSKNRDWKEFSVRQASVDENLQDCTKDLFGRYTTEPLRMKDDSEKLWETESREKYVTLEDFKSFAAGLSKEPSLAPSNSASHHPAINNPRRMSLSRIQEDVDSLVDEIEGTVIGGYEMTAAQKIRELDSYSSIQPIRGLPKMFTSERLNFLTHIHSALFQVLSDETGKYPSNDCLKTLLDPKTTWRNDPSTALLELVIDKTIDQKTGIVKANPFKLPIIEVTMELTPKIMYMALDQLHREFEIEWFSVMKFVTTPKFQSKYDKIRFKGDSRHRHVDIEHQRKSSSSSGRSTSRRSSSSDTGSVLSAIFTRH
jgi:hypothetical protein